MEKMNKSQMAYIDRHLSLAASAEISADQLLADEHFMLALEADEILTKERRETTKLLSKGEYDKLEIIHQKES